MDENRLKELAHWREGQLFRRYGDEGAALRLRTIGIKAALAITPPTPEELQWTDIQGWPINPDHGCYREAKR